MSNPMRYNVLVITPSDIVAAGVAEILSRSREFVHYATLPDVSYYSESKFSSCDVVLVDPSVASYDQRAELRRVLSGRGVPVLALQTSAMDASLVRAFDGVVSLYDSMDSILARLSSAIEQSSASPSPRNESEELSARERDILTAVAKGKTNKEIADELNISIHTVITHRKNISHKLGINSISGLTVYAILNRLIDVNEY